MPPAVLKKVLVANRGEVAIRAFRAAYEVDAQTVAVFPHENRGPEHRQKADEVSGFAREIGYRNAGTVEFPLTIAKTQRVEGGDLIVVIDPN